MAATPAPPYDQRLHRALQPHRRRSTSAGHVGAVPRPPPAPASVQSPPLHGIVPAGGHYLVAEAAGAAGPRPPRRRDATGTIADARQAGQVALATGTAALTPSAGNVADPASSTSSATAAATRLRGHGADARRLSQHDLASRAARPARTPTTTRPTSPPATPTRRTPASDPAAPAGPGRRRPSPRSRAPAPPARWPARPSRTDGRRHRGVPHRRPQRLLHPDRRHRRRARRRPHDASDAIFVFGVAPAAARSPSATTSQVTGTVSEFNGITEITPAAARRHVARRPARPGRPRRRSRPARPPTPAARSLEGDAARTRPGDLHGHQHLLAPTSTPRSAWPRGTKPLIAADRRRARPARPDADGRQGRQRRPRGHPRRRLVAPTS